MASLTQARRLVVKIGSALLVDRETGLRVDWLRSLSADLFDMRRRGVDVVVVSSGSIALGRRVLGLPDGPLPLEQSQAAAAVGQIRLARAYEEVLGPHGLTTAQVLLTLEDSVNRRRYLNTRATLGQLLALGVIPIVNENDTVATDEIRFGDNDRLAAQVAATIGADQLVLLSDVDGLYTANPGLDPTAKRFDVVEQITPEIEAMAGEGISGLSRGGMVTKLMAAKMAMGAGCAMVIAKGAEDRPLSGLMSGAPCTWFLPDTDPQQARKRWIAAMKTRGRLVIDDGAAQALRQGKSLLPAGIRSVTGSFGRGDPVEIGDRTGAVLGKGLSRYTADEARVIKGRQSGEILDLLGYAGRAALIHRDDMVL
ncbi:glutamate 5-kinase [Pseudoruegeria sp. SK021]|uniref:glutamate 5-kinase n=1 Tax=Pseudoruegeria sp. SK021 TaxID=1933035 RepID=UPI000A216FA6|nr:glutamate 5-kinase [Pseudoruegeria sp. SK021]OSP56370.1 glutamate 5-kinase [Pseudoruegeria sp. SK021]